MEVVSLYLLSVVTVQKMTRSLNLLVDTKYSAKLGKNLQSHDSKVNASKQTTST